MACVNTNSRAFKLLAKDANISEAQLELLVHEFINQEGYDGKSYPSVDYINYKLEGKETLCGVLSYKLWEEQYSKPIVVNTTQEMLSTLELLGQIYDANAIGVKFTNNGKIEISVKKPIKVNDTAFLEHGTELLNTRQDENLRLFIKNNQNTTISVAELLNYVKNKTDNYNPVLDILERKGLLDNIQVKIHPEADYNFVPQGKRNADTHIGRLARRAYFSNGVIHINGNAAFVDGDASSIAMHEIMHAVTVNKLAASPKLRNAFYDIIQLYLENSNRPYPITHLYDYKSQFALDHGVAEFVADVWSDPILIEELKRIEVEENGEKLTLWDKVKNFFSNLFTGDLFRGIKDKSLMAKASNTMIELLNSVEESPVIDLLFHEHWDSFNGLPIKDGFIENDIAARYTNNEILLNRELLRQKYEEKAWTEPRLQKDGSKANALSKSLFTSYEEFEQFVLTHEYMHNVFPRDNSFKTTGEYETFINEKALLELDRQLVYQDKDKKLSAIEEREKENQRFIQSVSLLRKEMNQIELANLQRDIANAMSDVITDAFEHPEKFELLEGLSKNDIEKMTRQQMVEKIGVDNFMNIVFKSFAGNKSLKFAKTRLLLVKEGNWQTFVKLAMTTFKEHEKFAIIQDGTANNVVESEMINNNEEYNEDQSDSEVAEKGDTQEHWLVEARSIETEATLSQKVREALNLCYLLEKNADGELVRVKTDNAVDRRIEVKDATYLILSWTEGCFTLKEMIEKLEMLAESNSWVILILEKLLDTTGKYADFLSLFFNNFCKSMQLYSVVRRKGKNLISNIVNRNLANKVAMDNIIAAFNVGQHPLFTSSGVVNKTELDNFTKLINLLDTLYLNEQSIGKIASLTASAVASLGFIASEDLYALAINKENYNDFVKNLKLIKENLIANLDNSNYSPFTYKSDGSIYNYVKAVVSSIAMLIDAINVNVTVDNGKMYLSRTIPSYLTKLMAKFKQLDLEKFREFIEEEYGKYEWFAYQDESGNYVYRNVWLDKLMKDPNARKQFEHKVLLNYNKKKYMKEMNSAEYTVSLIAEYFSETRGNTNAIVPAWFRVPMLSNKPSSEFIKFDSYRGVDYKNQLTDNFFKVFEQELSRIQTCKRRKEAGIVKGDKRYIKNFDENGHKFLLLDFMQNEVDNSTELGLLINKKLNESKDEPMTSSEIRLLLSLAKEKIKTAIDEKADKILEQWEKNGVVAKSKLVESVGVKDEIVRENLRNFIWNDAFASTQIMELTITDPSYYKDAEDLQKRMAEIHAPGVRGNVNAIDYNGKTVTDGKLRTIYIQDSEIMSNVIDNISEVFDRKIAEATNDLLKKELLALKDSLVGKNGAYKNVNVTDALAYTGLTALRKKAIMLGKWNREKEDLYLKIKKGEKYEPKDVIAFTLILKPFVYSQIEKSTNAADVPMSKLKVPVLNKNSEYLLMMADALLSNEKTTKPNILKVISEIMEESEKGEIVDDNYIAGTSGIDVIQFNSTVKSGEQGVIDINNLENEEDIKNTLREAIYGIDEQGNARINDAINYDMDVVHHYPAEDYAELLSVPEHFKEHLLIYGSLIRAIIEGDQQNATYTLSDGRLLGRQEFREEYEKTIAANVLLSINKLREELQLDLLGLQTSNMIISRILQREILSNPRYGIDMAIACSINPQTGKFNIPLGDPLQSKRIELLINSIIKNRVNKLTIAGGPVVQVSNFGASKQLNIRFKDKEGNLLLTREEWEKEKNDGTYEDYIKENQSGIAHWEVLAPIYSDELLKFADKNGVINIKAIEKVNPELLELIGYRIPTEDKYSMAPLKIVGFLPREAGDAIMLPSEITTITGSDFDVDKFYLMRKELPFKGRHVNKNKFYNALIEGKNYTTAQKELIAKLVEDFLQDPMNPRWSNTKAFDTYLSMVFELKEIKDERVINNNHLVDMTKAVLTSEHNADRMLNPGGFEEQKKMGYVVLALKANPKLKYELLMQMSTKELKNLGYRSKNLIFIDEQIGFYQQNSAAASLISTFAVHKSSHSIYEGDGMGVTLNALFDIAEDVKPFSIGSTTFGSTEGVNVPIEIDPTFDSQGILVSKTLGSVLAASVDAVKDPVLNLINVNLTTSAILEGMLRTGVPFEEAALFLAQKPVVDLIEEIDNSKLSKPKFIGLLIDEKIVKYKDTKLSSEDLSKEEMIKNLTAPTEESTAKALIMLKRMSKLASIIQKASLISRFNSISSAVGPLIIDNIIMNSKLRTFPESIVDKYGNLITVLDILDNHPMLDAFLLGYNIANLLFLQMSMPLNSVLFLESIEAFPDDLLTVMFRDRALLSKFGNFYLSYKLINNIDHLGNEKTPVIDAKKLAYYKLDFIKDYLKKSNKFSDNLLIQAIKLSVNSETGYVDLKLDLKGLTNVEKERLTAGWAELWKGEGKELARSLFEYNFFKGGIEFSPKTIVSLLPLLMRQELEGYLDVFENEYPVNKLNLVDLFIRNNSDNVKLVPIIKETKLTAFESREGEFVSKTLYNPMFKDAKGNMFLHVGFVEITNENGEIEKLCRYKQIEPLGTDGFMDISPSKIDKTEKRTTEKRNASRNVRITDRGLTLEEMVAIMQSELSDNRSILIEEASIEEILLIDNIIHDSIDNTIDEDVTNQLDVTEEYDGRFDDANSVKEKVKEMSVQTFLNSAYTLRERLAYQQMPIEMKSQQKDKIIERMKEKAAKFSNFKFDDKFFNDCLEKLC